MTTDDKNRDKKTNLVASRNNELKGLEIPPLYLIPRDFEAMAYYPTFCR